MVGDWEVWWDSWLLHLTAEHRRPKTIAFYQRELGRFSDTLDRGPLEIGRDDIRRWVRGLVDGGLAANTINNRLIVVKSFFTWLVKEGELTLSPAASVAAPKHQGPDPAVLSDDEFGRLLALTSGAGPFDRRNRAILLVLESSGCRAGELVSMTDKGCDLHAQRIDVEGKGGQWRPVPISAAAAEAVDRYRRVRRLLRGERGLWWGKKGDLTTKGLDHLLGRLGDKAGVDCHAHRFRHRFSHRWLDAGGSEAGLQVAAGWSSVAMPRRYGRALSVQRMLDEHTRLFG